MKLKTSWFNKTAFKKDILRYSPIWALHTIFLLLVLFGMADYSRDSLARNIVDFLKPMALINLIYGGVCGVFLFMDLFNNRLCNALHAFPMRREGWLTTHILSGVLFSLVPNLLASGIGALMLWEYAYLAPVWLAISTMQFLFFFGTAVLAATCAGNLLGTAAIYGITHFITMFVYAVAQLLYQPLLHGVRLNGDVFLRFFPLNEMDGFDYVKLEYYHDELDRQVEFRGFEGEAWLYVGICAGVGLLCLFLACLVYRRRNLEAAGDFISLKPLAPLFLLVCTTGAGAFLFAFSDLVGNKTYLFLVIGMVIGYFAGKMFLNRTLKVFGKKSLLGLAVLVAVFGGSLLVTWLDPMGITTYVPKAENVETAYIHGADKSYYFVMEQSLFSYYGAVDDGGYEITDSHELANLQDFHRQLTRYRPSEGDGVLCDVRIHYKLKNGRTVTRYYEVGRYSAMGQRALEYFSDMRYIFEVNDTELLYDAFDAVVVDIYESKYNINFKLTDQQEIAGLLDAIAKDCEAGKMAQNWAFHDETGKTRDYNLEFSMSVPGVHKLGWDTNHFYLQIYADSTNTIAYMNAMRQLHWEQEEPPVTEPILDPLPE